MLSNIIQDTVLQYWQGKRNAKGWFVNNAVCCIHNGETVDTRNRGGVIVNTDNSISYSCFNCNFSTRYTPGFPMGHKFRKLLKWLNVDDLEIQRLVIESIREKEQMEMLGLIAPSIQADIVNINFTPEPLPEDSMSFMQMAEWNELKGDWSNSKQLSAAVEYVYARKINLNKYEFYLTSTKEQQLNTRVIVPFYWKGQLIGYSARAMSDDVSAKYVTRVDNGFVFNIDKQQKNWQFVIVCEGLFDAMSIDGVAVMHSSVTATQVNIIESLNKEIIVVPDWNHSGQDLIDAALDNGWGVSFPVWAETCIDINDAVVKYGKLFALKAIVDAVEHNPLKIKLLRKNYGH